MPCIIEACLHFLKSINRSCTSLLLQESRLEDGEELNWTALKRKSGQSLGSGPLVGRVPEESSGEVQKGDTTSGSVTAHCLKWTPSWCQRQWSRTLKNYIWKRQLPVTCSSLPYPWIWTISYARIDPVCVPPTSESCVICEIGQVCWLLQTSNNSARSVLGFASAIAQGVWLLRKEEEDALRKDTTLAGSVCVGQE